MPGPSRGPGTFFFRLHIHDLFTQRRKGDARQLEVRQAEGDADDRYAIGQAQEQVADGQPDPGEDDPQQIGEAGKGDAWCSEGAGIDEVASERKSGKAGDAPRRHGKGKADDCQRQDQACAQPAQRHRQAAAEDKPEYISKKSHVDVGTTWSLMESRDAYGGPVSLDAVTHL